MRENAFAAYDAIGLAELIRRRQASPSEVLEAAIAAIEEHNPRLNAVVHKAYDEARPVAGSHLPEAPFAGVPFLVKALYCPVAGWPAHEGSRGLVGRRSDADGTLAGRWRAAGLVLLGSTNTPEFGITGTTEGQHHGPCRNPWSTDYIAGGSSGGAAAAVAVGILPMAHASDGLGSIRIPASCCGLVGLKTTRHRNPIGPQDIMRASDMSVDHVVTRTVRDSAAMLDWTGKPEQDDYFAAPLKVRPYVDEVSERPGRMRIWFSEETPRGTKIHADVRRVLNDTVRTLGELGHAVEEKSLTFDWRAFYRAQGRIGSAQTAAWFARWEAERGGPIDDIEPLSRALIELGRASSAVEVMDATISIRRLSRAILRQFAAFDVYLTPVMITPPPRIGYIDPCRLEPREVYERQAATFGFTPPFNATGQPSVSLPLGMSAEGLPIGMMFTARYGDEATLFRLAAQLEDAMPWRQRKPPLFGTTGPGP
jgi:amidase